MRRSGSTRGRRRARRTPRPAGPVAWPGPRATASEIEHADARRVDGLERRDVEDPESEVAGEEAALDVVAGEAPGHLGQVVRAEGEEVDAWRGDLAGGERGPRHLDHGAERDGRRVRDRGEHALELGPHGLQLVDGGDQRHHDLRPRVEPFAARAAAAASATARTCMATRPGMTMPEPDAAQPEHRVLLVDPLDGGEQRAVVLGVRVVRPRVVGPRHPLGELLEAGQELVQGRVDEPDGDGQPVHRAQDARRSRPAAAGAARRGRPRARRRTRPGRAARSARAARRGTCARCGTGRCPAAPKRRARAASSGVSAFACTPSRRTWSACASQPVDGRDERRRPSGTAAGLEVLARSATAAPGPRRGRPGQWSRPRRRRRRRAGPGRRW